jgi:hypothetical protein
LDAELHRIRAAEYLDREWGDAAVREALTRAIAITLQRGSETFRRRAAADFAALGAPAH